MKPIFFLLVIVSTLSFAARIKDIAMLKGARNNQLIGYGLVVGLPGTGDKSNELTQGSVSLMLKGLGLETKAQNMETKNMAVVVVSTTLPPFTRLGTNLDVTVSSIGSAQSLDGGTLMMTALKGADGRIYAMSQGKINPIRKSDKGSGGGGGNLVSAVIPNGAILEREVAFDFAKEKELRYLLLNPDFTTAARMAKKINEELGGKYATSTDPSTVDVLFPYQFEGTPVELVAQLESIEVETDRKAKVVINPRTGTVILGEAVRIAPVAIAHANLKVEVSANDAARAVGSVQQEAADTASKAGDASKAKRVLVMNNGTNIAEVVMSLNEMGATPDDLITLLQSLKAAGALMADLEMQ
jgi:flagellar P-ring protein FlgI